MSPYINSSSYNTTIAIVKIFDSRQLAGLQIYNLGSQIYGKLSGKLNCRGKKKENHLGKQYIHVCNVKNNTDESWLPTVNRS